MEPFKFWCFLLATAVRDAAEATLVYLRKYFFGPDSSSYPCSYALVSAQAQLSILVLTRLFWAMLRLLYLFLCACFGPCSSSYSCSCALVWGHAQVLVLVYLRKSCSGPDSVYYSCSYALVSVHAQVLILNPMCLFRAMLKFLLLFT